MCKDNKKLYFCSPQRNRSRSLMDRIEDSGSLGWGSIPHGSTKIPGCLPGIFVLITRGATPPEPPAAQGAGRLKAAWLRPRTSYRSGLAFRQTDAGAYGLECTLGVAPPRQGPISGDGAGTSPPEYGITLMCPRLFGEYAPTRTIGLTHLWSKISTANFATPCQ